MMWAKLVNDELYVYWNGRLIYKKWLSTGSSALFDKYGPPIWSRK